MRTFGRGPYSRRCRRMGKLFRFYSWRHIKLAAWLFRQTRHECNRCCLWCEFFDRCLYDKVREVEP